MSVFLHAYTIQILHFYIDICKSEYLFNDELEQQGTFLTYDKLRKIK